VRRREFITLAGGIAAVLLCPLAAQAQQAMPVVGYLSAMPLAAVEPLVAAFRKGLGETGYVEGRSVTIEYRSADGNGALLPSLAAELVERKVAVIAASGGTPAARAATAATTTIPVVFTTAGDPVKLGLVASLRRPGGNATGVSVLTAELEARRLELLREVGSRTRIMAFLVNPNDPNAEAQTQEVRAAARAVGQKVVVVEASTDGELDAAVRSAVEQKARALLVATDAFFSAQRERLVAIVAEHRLPALYPSRDFVAAGGLMSYVPSLADAHRQVGLYAGRILKGAKPARLPVARPSTFELAVNLKTAKALGITVPSSITLRANEVIE
jgi:putative ABC transport system substrate-binding protein